jgi:hypothetical protein
LFNIDSDSDEKERDLGISQFADKAANEKISEGKFKEIFLRGYSPYELGPILLENSEILAERDVIRTLQKKSKLISDTLKELEPLPETTLD